MATGVTAKSEVGDHIMDKQEFPEKLLIYLRTMRSLDTCSDAAERFFQSFAIKMHKFKPCIFYLKIQQFLW